MQQPVDGSKQRVLVSIARGNGQAGVATEPGPRAVAASIEVAQAAFGFFEEGLEGDDAEASQVINEH